MDLPVYELEIDSEKHGTFTISVVDEPAHESDFVAFSKNIKFSSIKEDERIITGAVLIPDVMIYRNNPEPHYVKMSKDTIKNTQLKFSKLSDTKAINFGHDTDNTTEVTIVENWIITDKDNDKSNSLGLDLPEGTWVASMYVEDPEKWDEIKNQDLYNGFSVEGFYKRTIIDNPVEEAMMEEQLKELQAKFEKVEAENKELKEQVIKFEEEAKPTEEVEEKPADEPKKEEEEAPKEEEVKAEKTFTQEEVEVMIKEAVEAALKVEETPEEEEDEVDTVMSREATNKGSDLMSLMNKIKSNQ